MVECHLCERKIPVGSTFGFCGINDQTKPVCFQCMRMLIKTDGKYIGIKDKIKKWLTDENYSFSQINEPTEKFHFIIKDVGNLRLIIEIVQEREESDIVIGFLTFLSDELTYKIYRFTKLEKENFKIKTDEFLSTLRVDYRTGFRVGFEIITERGRYGAKYFVRIKPHDCNKEKFNTAIEMIQDTSEKIDEFLNKEILN